MEKDINAEAINIEKVLNKKYIIPIYQRPYAWDKGNIFKLVKTILSSGNIYLGNILIENGEPRLKIVDGQQRITTLLLILYYLDNKKYNKEKIQQIITIESENEIQKLNKLFENSQEQVIKEIERKLNGSSKEIKQNENELRSINIYELNFYYITKFLEKENKEELLNKILNQIFVVNVEIKSNLNTTEIFDMINTTGKPLDVKDKFKVRMYNYTNNKDIVNEIDKLYENINKQEIECTNSDNIKQEELFKEYKTTNNKSKNYIRIDSEKYDIEYFLRLYKFFLIAKKRRENAGYGTTLFEMSYERFFDNLFETLFETKMNKNIEMLENIKIEELKEEEQIDETEDDEELEEENYDNILEDRKIFQTFIKDSCVNIKDIKEIFEILTLYKNFVSNKEKWNTADAYFSYKLFKCDYCNRYYYTYQYLPILYFYNFKNKIEDEIFVEKFERFIISLSKLCSFYSINWNRRVKECKRILTQQSEKLLKPNTIIDIKEYTKEFEKNVNEIINNKIEDLEFVLDNDITENRNRKNTICLILAAEAEKNNEEKAKENIDKLFCTLFDIEHIYARAANYGGKKLDAKIENGIGNLMILESSINRSIGDNKIDDKIEGYEKSKFNIVQKFKKDFEEKYSNETSNYLEDIDNRIKINKEIIKKYFGL